MLGYPPPIGLCLFTDIFGTKENAVFQCTRVWNDIVGQYACYTEPCCREPWANDVRCEFNRWNHICIYIYNQMCVYIYQIPKKANGIRTTQNIASKCWKTVFLSMKFPKLEWQSTNSTKFLAFTWTHWKERCQRHHWVNTFWKIWKTSQQVRKIGWTGWLAGEKQGSNSSFLKSLRSRPGAPRKNATPMGYRSEMKGMYWGQAWPMQCFWKPDTFGDIHSCFFRWGRYLGYFVVYITCTCKHAVPWCFPSKIV